MKEKYIAPVVEMIVIEAAVKTLEINNSSNTEGSAVMLSWLIEQ